MTTDDFVSAVRRNPVHEALLAALHKLKLPDAWIVAGCLTQTVWNMQTDRPAGYGIDDYDIFYFDPDRSWEAEDRVISAFRPWSDACGVRIEVRNQARVHLWYPEKHGKPYPALARATDGIDRFLTRCTQVGLSSDGSEIYAPAGLDEITSMTVRPNITANFSTDAYHAKCARWQALWPELTLCADALSPPE